MADRGYNLGFRITDEMAEDMRRARFDYIPTATEGESRPLTREGLDSARAAMRRGDRFAIASTPTGPNAFYTIWQQEYELNFDVDVQPSKSPDPAERERAMNLLETVVDKDAIDGARPYDVCITIRTSTAEYRVVEGGFTWCIYDDKRELRCYDIGREYHPIDKMIAEILLIQTDEDRYLRESNAVGTALVS